MKATPVGNNFFHNLHICSIVGKLKCYMHCFLHIIIYSRYLIRGGGFENYFDFRKIETSNNEQKVVIEIFNILVVFFWVCGKFWILAQVQIAKHNPKLIKWRILNKNKTETGANRIRTLNNNAKYYIVYILSLGWQNLKWDGCFSFFGKSRN